MRWRFAGRDEAIAPALDRLRSGQSLVITGGAGVGKTRLAMDLVDRLDVAPHAVVRFGAAPALELVPLGALARYALDDGGPSPDDAGRWTDDGDPERHAARLQAVHRALLESVADDATPSGPAGRRMVLLIDDVHWLDPMSAAAVAQLIVAGDALMVATRRDGQVAPEPIRRLRTAGDVDSLELAPFTLDELGEVLVANVGPMDRQTVVELRAATGGNALLVEDLVRAASATGSLVQTGTSWVWDRSIPAEAQLNDLIEDRVARLSGDEVDALTLIATGEPLPLAVARRAIDQALLVALEREGIVLIGSMGDEDVRLSHPLYGDIVRARMGGIERAERFARLVDAASRAAPPPDPARVAVWCLDAGTAVDAVHLVAASERAIAAGDGRLALRLAQRALDAGDRPDALVAVGRSMVLGADAPQAVSVLTPLLERPGVLDAVRVEAGLWLLTAHGPDLAAAQVVLDTVLAHLDDPDEGDLLRAQWAFSLIQGNRWPEALVVAEALVASPRDDVAMRAMQPLVVATLTGGRCSDAADLAAAALPRALGLADTVPEAVRWVFGCCVTSWLNDGRLADVEALLDLAGGAATPAGAEGYFSMIRGKLALLQGRPRTARTELEAAEQRLRRADGDEWRDWTRALLVEAVTLCEPAATSSDLTITDDDEQLDARRARAWSAMASGDRKACFAELNAAADRFAEIGNVPSEVFALHDALRLGANVSRRLEEVTGRFQSRWSEPARLHAQGRRERDADLLGAAAQGFEDVGAVLVAAECWAASARQAAEDGLRAKARQASVRSTRCAAMCEGAVTPGLELPSTPIDLTTRERRVAHEAAAGRRSKEIAEGLGISVRTVDNLLGRVYVKLGVSGRDELAEVLGAEPTP